MKKHLLLAVLTFLLGASGAQIPKAVQSCKLKIGDPYAGGIVFYLTPGAGCHGLVCAPYDQANDIPWYDAVTLCNSLKINGYLHWRLPSKEELNQMFKNLHKAGLGGFTNEVYWSSTENSSASWTQNFATSTQGPVSQYYNGRRIYVRAVRAF